MSDTDNPVRVSPLSRLGISITLQEEQRQLVLMALAHLAVERPGFDYALSNIAKLMDNVTVAGRPEMYDTFRSLKGEVHRDG